MNTVVYTQYYHIQLHTHNILNTCLRIANNQHFICSFVPLMEAVKVLPPSQTHRTRSPGILPSLVRRFGQHLAVFGAFATNSFTNNCKNVATKSCLGHHESLKDLSSTSSDGLKQHDSTVLLLSPVLLSWVLPPVLPVPAGSGRKTGGREPGRLR